ncbi:acetyltransferase [Sphingomonas sp. RB56-2]|uniref:Acetyltransferase n=1 Tax=Sphingomonas brevis TaxID=2908206 RepID=A0ABT0SAJ0_9SPHN|nr:acetyltransferase [Sphingomonas brevis]MCL6741424.1 acetyltransferase [Sphingomonas brevis]
MIDPKIAPLSGQIRASTAGDGNRVVSIWRDAVDATHHFLTVSDRLAIDVAVRDFLPSAPMMLWVDDHDVAVGFMILTEFRMEALFVDPSKHGMGIGRRFVEYALERHPTITTEVNEQNHQARRFYDGVGFETVGRSELDEEGRPYPLLHLQLRRSAYQPRSQPHRIV